MSDFRISSKAGCVGLLSLALLADVSFYASAASVSSNIFLPSARASVIADVSEVRLGDKGVLIAIDKLFQYSFGSWKQLNLPDDLEGPISLHGTSSDSRVVILHGSLLGKKLLLYLYDPDKKKALWVKSLKARFGGDVPCDFEVSDGKIYVSDNLGVKCFDLKNGSMLWRRDENKAASAEVVKKVEAVVLTLSEPGMPGIVCGFSSLDGQLLWSFDAGALVTSGLRTVRGVVIFGTYHEPKGGVPVLYCLDIRNGKRKWKFECRGEQEIVGNYIQKGMVFDEEKMGVWFSTFDRVWCVNPMNGELVARLKGVEPPVSGVNTVGGSLLLFDKHTVYELVGNRLRSVKRVATRIMDLIPLSDHEVKEELGSALELRLYKDD